MVTENELSRVRRVVYKYDRFLLSDRHVNGVGVGFRIVDGCVTDQPCMRIYVTKKLPRRDLSNDDLLPAFFDAGDGERVVTDIVEAGPFYFQSDVLPRYTAKIRPAQPGTSIGAKTVTAGTFGAVVIDNVTDESLILSNNHVLADNNSYAIGGCIGQPGVGDDGIPPDDFTIATLLRFVALQPKPCDNLVDCAVALPTDPSIISPVPLAGFAPTPETPAVALHFAGSPPGGTGTPISIGNPIETVLSELGVHFPLPGSIAVATPTMPVQKVGRTTGLTFGTVDAINVTVAVGSRTFVNQITFSSMTGPMTGPGDSGSLYVTYYYLPLLPGLPTVQG
jgi:hypothetical protein